MFVVSRTEGLKRVEGAFIQLNLSYIPKHFLMHHDDMRKLDKTMDDD